MLESPNMLQGTGNTARLFLASSSPRRRELFSLGGWEYSILYPQVDETPLIDEDGVDYVLRIAKSKVNKAASQGEIEGVIIAADTSVVYHSQDGTPRILGKPGDPDEAVEMLRLLRGNTHQVHTAIAVLFCQGGIMWSDLCTTNVTMRNYSLEETKAYVASGDPLDKAGAYAIQHAQFHPVEQLDGCFANVMGLPLCHLTRCLTQGGINQQADIPQACQAAIGYNCPVYPQILPVDIKDYRTK
jgi:MAF protein